MLSAITVCISIVIAAVSATWSVSQYVHGARIKHILQLVLQKIEMILDSIKLIRDLLTLTRKTYVTKDLFNVRCQLVDTKHNQLTEDTNRQIAELKINQEMLLTKVDLHILLWAKSGK